MYANTHELGFTEFNPTYGLQKTGELHMNEPKKKIEQALHQFARGNLAGNAKHLLNVLGYESERTMNLDPNTADSFLSAFNLQDNQGFNPERALISKWESIDVLFQLTEEEIGNNPNLEIDFGDGGIDDTRMESYLFFAIKLSGDQYSRTQLSQITREMNKPFGMPAMILFQHGDTLTFAVIDRRLNKRYESKDVLLKATLIKDISFADPHRAHIDILFDLSIAELDEKYRFRNFEQLHEAWKKTLDTSELNKRFYKEIANWYFWAVDNVTFPDGAEKKKEVRNATSTIRLITRLIFVWFIKEKGLVPNDLFNHEKIKEILRCTDDEESTYYKAILQNLFFATLNQEMNTPDMPRNRKFRGEGRQHYNITSLYRYKRYFAQPDEALGLFESIPFLNGGLFECLDKPDKDDPQKILRVDGFSDRDDVSLHVPNLLFFSDERTVDLNAAYGTRGKQYQVRGLVEILDRYKFTITENTPIEEEVALDPELLGRVFENLLAAYNPETGATARKQTGSYYTPREIVDYMTDESLIAYLKHKCIAYHEARNALTPTIPPIQLNLGGRAEPVQTQIDTQGLALSDEQIDRIEQKFCNLVAYNGKSHQFSDDEADALIRAIDSIKILDPACGSGAFPMGVLHKLVFILGKLDPRNHKWKQRQIDKVRETIRTAESIEDSTVRDSTIRDLEREIESINEAFERNELDYGRKLYLIENCIYGVDIQPIAVQIAKLRFFISLVVDQQIDETRENRGVRALPNLETKFVAANTLIGLDKPIQIPIRNPQIDLRERELADVRRKHFTARTPKTKDKYRALDTQLRSELSGLLKDEGFPHETTEKVAFWDPYDQNSKADWFDAEWMFAVREGLDVVIGNPPYIGERVDEKIFHEVARTEFGKKFYTRWMDYFYFFFHRSIDLGNRKSVIALITTNYFITATGANRLRKDLYERTTIMSIINFNELKIFESSQGQHNAITIATKDKTRTNKAKTCITRRTGIASAEILESIVGWEDTQTQYYELSQEHLYEGPDNQIRIGGYGSSSGNLIQITLEKLKELPDSLGDICHVLMGLVSRADKVSASHLRKYPSLNAMRGEGIFVLSPKELKSLHLSAEDYAKYVRPFYKNSDICRYFGTPENKYWLLYVKDEGKPITLSQELRAHFEKFEVLLTKGKENFLKNKIAASFVRQWLKNGNYFVLFNPKEEEYFTQPKIVAPYRSRENFFTYNETDWFASQDVCFILAKDPQFDLKYVLALLNSKLYYLWLYHKGKRKGENLELCKKPISDIPIKRVIKSQQMIFVDLVNQILALKRTNLETDISTLEDEINREVYSLYDLTLEEIAIVEENTV